MIGQFDTVTEPRPPRSYYPWKYSHKTTFNGNVLFPIFLQHVMPGDHHKVALSAFVRYSNPIKPSMDRAYIDVHFFFVPHRLTWKNFEDFITGSSNNQLTGDASSGSYYYENTKLVDDNNVFTVPQLKSPQGGFGDLGLADYFGLELGKDMEVSVLPFRAYRKVMFDWFVDETFQSYSFDVGDKTDRLTAATQDSLFTRNKKKDYFTSAFPTPQKGVAPSIGLSGFPAVTNVYDRAHGASKYGDNYIPLVGDKILQKESPRFSNVVNGFPPAPAGSAYLQGQVGGSGQAANVSLNSSGINPYALSWAPGLSSGLVGVLHDDTYFSDVRVDLSSIPGISVNKFRLAFQVQKALERDMRSGTRFAEYLYAHWSVHSDDARIDRSEFLGMSRFHVDFMTVPQTSSTNSTTPQGNLAAYAIASSHGNGFNRQFKEHGYIIGVCSAIADITYQRGIPKHFSYKDRFDFYLPVFQALGEQPILNKEIFYSNDFSKDNAVFGYQEAWADRRYKQSMVTGRFRSGRPTPLDVWHFAEEFTSLPVLSERFLAYNVPFTRNQAVTNEPTFIGDFFFDHTAVRPMPQHSHPGDIDHF